ncbi:MAG TPA: hypothetical protein VM555_02545, partial [Tahibacter sp.]|nr:hypothetical protein [Tahibacter sp.]
MDANYPDRTPPGRLRNRLALSAVIRLTVGAAYAWSAAIYAQSPPVPDAAPIEPRGSAGVPAYVEYDKKVRASEQLSPL